MHSKGARIAGWCLSLLVSTFLIVASGGGKFLDWEGKEEMFAKMGYTTDLMFKIGVVEVLVAIMVLIPRLSFLGAVLLTAYLGGATEVHVRAQEPFFMPIIIGVLVWVGLGLRQPEIFRMALGSGSSRASTPPPDLANGP